MNAGFEEYAEYKLVCLRGCLDARAFPTKFLSGGACWPRPRQSLAALAGAQDAAFLVSRT